LLYRGELASMEQVRKADEVALGEVLPCEVREPLSRFIERFSRLHRLSPHQTAVVWFAASGHCRKESAVRMGCSLKTVEEHWRRVYLKTGCGSEPKVVAKLLVFALTHQT
jgi:DNA-binding CsgD family transcriptional regulator